MYEVGLKIARKTYSAKLAPNDDANIIAGRLTEIVLHSLQLIRRRAAKMTPRYKFTIDASGDSRGKAMSVRLGNVVVWVSYGFCDAFIGVRGFRFTHHATAWIVSTVVGGGAIVVGYAIRNFLTGNQKA